MNNVYNDYVNKYNDKETLTISNEIKKAIEQLLINKFNLNNINPKIVVNEIINSNLRTINFDNCNEKDIHYLNNNNNLYLYKKLKQLNLDINNGLICYDFIIHRDFIKSNVQTNYEFLFNLVFKTLIANNNIDYITELVINLIDEINKLEVVKKFGKTINKIRVIDANKIFKEFPLIKTTDLLNETVFRYEAVLLINGNGNNIKKHYFINDNFIYGDIVASLFVYDKINNSNIKILTIYNTANKKQLEHKMLNNIQFNSKIANDIINEAEEYNNQIGIEFYLSQYLLYCLEKFSINEIID